jgi:hypothetical protein
MARLQSPAKEIDGRTASGARMKAAYALPTFAPTLGTGAVAVIMAVIVLRAFGGPDVLAGILFGAAAALVLSGYPSIPPRLRHTAFLLFGITLLLLPFSRSPLEAIQRGIFVSGQLLAMIASVLLLSQCALRSPRVQAIGAALRAQPAGRRYLSFTLVSQLFSGMMGMAGAHIMLVMAAPVEGVRSEERTATVIAVTRGFATAGFWSPVYGNMVILLALYPSLLWIEIFPIGLALAQASLVVGLLVNRYGAPQRAAMPAPTPDARAGRRLLGEALPLFAAMLIFMSLILTSSSLLAIGITATLVLVAPLTAVTLHLAMGDPGRRMWQAARNLRASAQLFPRLSSEAILFIAAGCAGSIMADAFPAPWAQQIGQTLADTPFLGIAFLTLSVMGMGLAGVHPVLSAVFLASTVTPELLGLPPISHMAAILTGWGLSAVLTPFSVLSLTASRYAGTTLYQISFGKNWAFASISALLACIALTAIALAG